MSNVSDHWLSQKVIVLFFTFLFIMLLFYISEKIGKRKEHCNMIRNTRLSEKNENIKEFLNMDDLIRNNYFKGSIDINNNTVEYDYRLKDYYIKTAYNCFCSSGFRNGFVDKCALENCASYGVRALHMQIFSLDQVPIVAANSLSTNEYKESYNEIPFYEALSIIDDTFFQSEDFGVEGVENNLRDDPLFLILQLHYGTDMSKLYAQGYSHYNEAKRTNQLIFYDKIYDTLVEQFNMARFASNEVRMLHPVDYEEKRSLYVADMKMKDLKKKIFIFVILNGEQDYSVLKESKLGSIVDLYGDNELNHHRFNDLNSLEQASNISKYTSKNMLSFCMPSLTSSQANYDFVRSMKQGTQFVGMNFQTVDSNLSLYNNFFIEQHSMVSSGAMTSPYIKKPDHMIDLPLTTTLTST